MKGKNVQEDLKLTISDSVDFLKFKEIYQKLKKNYDVSKILNELEKREIVIPISIFNEVLTPLQTISKYLVENIGLSYSDIARKLNRNRRIIWQAYKLAAEKYVSKFEIIDYTNNVSLSVFSDRSKNISFCLISYLKENLELRYRDIAKLLKRDERTIWTIYNRRKKK